MVLANVSVTIDPAWPWSLPGVGVSAFIGVAVALAAITVWTYMGVRAASWRRIGMVLALRLVALAVAFLVVLRPALAFEEVDEVKPSRLLLLLDYSKSMELTDEFNNLSRWDNARRILSTPTVLEALRRLTAAKVEITQYQAAEDLRALDPAGKPTGKATDMGRWLFEIRQRHGKEKNLRGLIILSDGADNGIKYPTLQEAAQLRGTCPIFAFGLGKPTTTPTQNDIELTDIRVDPDPVPVKGKMAVKGTVNAPGFENSRVSVSVWTQEIGGGKPKLAVAGEHLLTKTQGNEVTLTADAPDTPGEIKVTMKIQPLPGEVSILNNEISTYAGVTKEGVSILWVEGRRPRQEYKYARMVLDTDPRFRVDFVERLREEKPESGAIDPYELDKRHYDVIVIGDVSARRFAGGDPSIFAKIKAAVREKGTGLLFMGGYETPWADGNDWGNNPLAELLPVEAGPNGQIETKVSVEPTEDGKRYLLNLEEIPDKSKQVWRNILHPLEGITRLGKPKPTSTVLATGEGVGEPVLVEARSNGRILAFAGDTTWQAWRRTPEAVGYHARFWKQLMIYLARQENQDETVQITLEKRRLPADSGQRLPFTLRVRGKSGLDVKNPQFTVKVNGPNKEESDVPVLLEGGEYRGYFLKAHLAGDYRLEASVKGRDTGGNELSAKPSVAHFLAYSQDRESLRAAADHDFLTKVASASGGRFMLADERQLASLLESLMSQQDTSPRAVTQLWPDWRRHPASPSVADQIAALWLSTALPCFMAFVALLCSEWYLRRRWGLV